MNVQQRQPEGHARISLSGETLHFLVLTCIALKFGAAIVPPIRGGGAPSGR